MELICVTGFAGSGKDTVGAYFERHGYKRISFADNLKTATSVIFGWDRNWLEGNTPGSREWRETQDDYWSGVMNRPITPRHILQTFGTEIMRGMIHEDIWVFSLFKNLKPDGKYIITDVRFENEIRMARCHNATFIYVKRGECPEWYDLAKYNPEIMVTKHPEIHQSEWRFLSALPIDTLLVENDGTIADLESTLSKIPLP